MLTGMAGKRNAPVPDTLTGWRVLVVEDDYLLADDIKTALHNASAEVIGPVPTLAEAMVLLRNDVDVAVLDIGLRKMLAWPVAEVLLARQVPFVFATGYGPEMVPLAYAGVPHWVKPLDTDKLVMALSALFKQRRAKTMA